MFFYFNDGEFDVIELLMDIYFVDFFKILVDRFRCWILLLLRNFCDGCYFGYGE